ncbi:MAG: CHAT domain-containing tetratricopeptide repeat protein [Cyclobacteriaceae bacterium]
MKSLSIFLCTLFPLFGFSQFGNLSKALNKYVKEEVDELITEKNEEFETSTFNYAIAFLDKSESFENKQSGESIYKMAAFINTDEEEQTDRDDAKDLYELGKFNYSKRHYKLSEVSLKEALLEFEILDSMADPVYIKSLGLLGLLYSDMGRYEKAESYNEKALEAWREYHGEDSKGYAAEYLNKAVLIFNKGDYSKAERAISEAQKLVVAAEGKASMPYAIVLNNQAILYQYMGRAEEALPILNQSLSIAGEKLKEKSGTYLQLMTNKALLLQEMGDYEKARVTYKEAIELQTSRLKLNRKSDPDFAHMLNNFASLHQLMGNDAKAEELLRESLEIYKSKFGMKHPLVASAQHDLGNLFRSTGVLDKAEILISSALKINQLRLGEKHSKTVQTKEDLAIVKWKQGDMDVAEKLYSEVMEQTMSFINNFFAPLSESEKTKYWEKLRPRFYNFYNFAFAFYKENPALLDQALNYRIATKGLLINSTTKIKRSIVDSGDQELIGLYNLWVDQKKALATYYNMLQADLEEQGVNLTELEIEANQTERKLSESSTAFSEAFVSVERDYKQILSKLRADEAAIEIIQYQVFENQLTTKNSYAAIVLRNAADPELIIMENGDALEGKYYSSYKNLIRLKVSDDYSYGQYWAKIDEKLSGVQKLYLSADGVYNQVSLNTLKTPEGAYLVESKEIIHVGNLGDLLEEEESESASKSAFLLGFPIYGSSDISPLPGTGKEVDMVSKALAANGYKVETYTANQATESAFKQVNSPQLIHVATHGYFMQDVPSKGSVFGVQMEYAKNNPLLRSGLLLAGASTGDVNENTSFDENDNGILTAYEAMYLPLQNTELVVLSACETGTGDVKSGEGVYGLQRAFTVAGAKRLVMSLWKVDDTATQMLMSGFYDNWVNKGIEPTEAFRKSQLTLMKTYPDPYYWGAFVMVQ